jgi:hypothetical protein
MPGLLVLLWLASVAALWVCVVRGFRDTAGEPDDGRRSAARTAIMLAAVPPTVVFLVCAFVLLQTAPTVQFNAGSSLAMSLWSFWVHWWPAIFGCSGLQTACYLVWFVGSLVASGRPSVRHVVGCGLLASVWGSLLLSIAYPSA